jgi:hypothetical protein
MSVGVVVAACGSTAPTPMDTAGNGLGDAGSSGASSGGGSGGGSGSGSPLPPSGDGGGFGNLLGDASLDGPPSTTTTEPQTCAQATQTGSYIGCDYWPTVVANNVWSVFDFAVVVANAGQNTAHVTVTGPGTSQTATVPAGQLAKIYLPWVSALKGADADNCGSSTPLVASVRAPASAFHLVSDVPVTVYQFNALEYAGQGGPPGKNWSSCPGDTTCLDTASPNFGTSVGCFSFSNDASLLLPSTAMTGNYRVAAHEGYTLVDPTSGQMLTNDAYTAITATQNATTVAVKLSGTARIAAGGGINTAAPGATVSFQLNQGDVMELAGVGGSDLSGSLVQASAPVQVITGMPCVTNPPLQPACDHVEESVFPAETMGKHYIVAQPAGPTGAVVGHDVRIYGNVDNTHLTYNPAAPPGCPATINAGQVVECGNPACPATIDVAAPATGMNCGITTQDFEIQGDQPFSVATFTLGATVVDPMMIEGDPAQSLVTAVEQYRSKYVFLAPSDYTVSYVGIVAKAGTTMTLDGQTLAPVPRAVGTSGYAAYRVKLGPGQDGAHVLTATQPVGIQVVGYGSFTSYMYPGGLDLVHIAPPPPPIQ